MEAEPSARGQGASRALRRNRSLPGLDATYGGFGIVFDRARLISRIRQEQWKQRSRQGLQRSWTCTVMETIRNHQLLFLFPENFQ